MSEATLEVNAVVREAMPSGLFRVEIEGERRFVAVAHAAGGGALVRLRPGDPVVVELTPYDTTRGRIVRRRT